jgi:hypothetical protein
MTIAELDDEWLPELVEFAAHGGDWHAYEEALYACFRADFIDSTPRYPGRRWAMKRHPEYKGKEATFWHIISEGPQEATRLPDLRRCERIRWPRSIIDACQTQRIRLWEQRRGAEKRIAIATPDFGYLVVLADRGSYVLLWTAFVVDREHQRRKLHREFLEWSRAQGDAEREKS